MAQDVVVIPVTKRIRIITMAIKTTAGCQIESSEMHASWSDYRENDFIVLLEFETQMARLDPLRQQRTQQNGTLIASVTLNSDALRP